MACTKRSHIAVRNLKINRCIVNVQKCFFFDATILKIGILRIVISVPNPFIYEIAYVFQRKIGVWGYV